MGRYFRCSSSDALRVNRQSPELGNQRMIDLRQSQEFRRTPVPLAGTLNQLKTNFVGGHHKGNHGA